MNNNLNAIHCVGLKPDCLGNYLAALGVSATLARINPAVRTCWLDDHLVVLARDLTRESLVNSLLDWEKWITPSYERWWKDKQSKDTTDKTDANVLTLRNTLETQRVRLMDSHLVGVGRNQFNFIFGQGGSIGRRDFSSVNKNAINLIMKAKDDTRRAWMESALFADRATELEALSSVGTWFGSANRIYNNGIGWYRDGSISPWSYLLALEGAFLLVGGASRRLGSNAKGYAVFPYTSEAPSPGNAKEVEMTRAEFWAPLWAYPATIVEIRGLLQRGLAKVRNRAAKAPHEFAVAAIAAGLDAGLVKFARFTLRETTNAKYYEALPLGFVAVNARCHPVAYLLTEVLPWLDKLPKDPVRRKQKIPFQGFRSPIERGITAIAEQPDDPERYQKLLLDLSRTQSKLDCNHKLRRNHPDFLVLDEAWFAHAFPEPSPEIHIARAVAAIGSSTSLPIVVNIFGVELDRYGNRFLSRNRPLRAVWHDGAPLPRLADVLQRRLIDSDKSKGTPFSSYHSCPSHLIASFLAGALDHEEIVKWIPAFSLIRWRYQPRNVTEQGESQNASAVSSDDTAKKHYTPKIPKGLREGKIALFELLKPFFHGQDILIGNKPLFPETMKQRNSITLKLLNLIRQEDWEEVLAVVRSRYLAAGRNVFIPPADFKLNGELIAAALLIPVWTIDVSFGITRWFETFSNNNVVR